MAWLAIAVTAGGMLFAASQHALPGHGSRSSRDAGAPTGSVRVEVDPRAIRLVSGRSPAP
jgi:hypothetical protein